jgi:hypothetical protein
VVVEAALRDAAVQRFAKADDPEAGMHVPNRLLNGGGVGDLSIVCWKGVARACVALRIGRVGEGGSGKLLDQ